MITGLAALAVCFVAGWLEPRLMLADPLRLEWYPPEVRCVIRVNGRVLAFTGPPTVAEVSVIEDAGEVYLEDFVSRTGVVSFEPIFFRSVGKA